MVEDLRKNTWQACSVEPLDQWLPIFFCCNPKSGPQPLTPTHSCLAAPVEPGLGLRGAAAARAAQTVHRESPAGGGAEQGADPHNHDLGHNPRLEPLP